MTLILGSTSRTRQDILRRAGIQATFLSPRIDEADAKAVLSQQGITLPDQVAIHLARAKALSISVDHPTALVIGADQVLSLDQRSFDKPANIAMAREQLKLLRGRTHYLETAVCVSFNSKIIWETIQRPKLTMWHFSDAFLDDYLTVLGGTVCETVGGYKVEDLGIQLFEHIEGDYLAILGLPLLELLAFLRATDNIGRLK